MQMVALNVLRRTKTLKNRTNPLRYQYNREVAVQLVQLSCCFAR